MRYPRYFLAAVIVALAGCDPPPTGPGTYMAARTLSLEYSSGQMVVFDVENQGDDVVGLPHCDHRIAMALDRRAGGQWIEAYRRSFCIAVLPSGVVSLRPGEVHRDSVPVTQPGTYRIRLPVEDDLSSLDTNVFTVSAR